MGRYGKRGLYLRYHAQLRRGGDVGDGGESGAPSNNVCSTSCEWATDGDETDGEEAAEEEDEEG